MHRDDPIPKNISNNTIINLPRYLSITEKYLNMGETHISSFQLSNELSLSNNLVRKDMSAISCIGKPRTGFNLYNLKMTIRHILGYDDIRHTIILTDNGENILSIVGNSNKFKLVISAVFAANSVKSIQPCYQDVLNKFATVYDIDALRWFSSTNTIDIAILDINDKSAQVYADKLVAYGIKAIWNFSHINITVPDNVALQSSGIEESLATLWYNLRTAKM